TDADITKALEDIKSGNRARIQIACGILKTAPANEIPAARIPEIAKTVEPFVSDGDMFVRQFAVEVLEKWATAEQVPVLIRALDASHWVVQLAAIRALGRLKDPRAAVPIGKLFGNQQYRHQAAEALKQIGGPEAEKVMRQALKDNDVFVRQQAAQVLK